MPLEFLIIAVGVILLAISVWRIAVWVKRNSGAVASQLPSRQYRRVQTVLLVFTCVVLVALFVAVYVWDDAPYWIVVVEILAALLVAELGRRAIVARLWRCASCGQALPIRIRRSGTNPASSLTCPSCGDEIVH